MRRLLHRFRPGFQTKVLVPVVAIMALLVVLPSWFLSRRMEAQLEVSAAENLATSDAIFRKLRPIQAKNLLLRYRNSANDPRFKAAAKLGDVPTLRFQLKELLEEQGGEAVLYVDALNQPVGHASSRSDLDLEAAARDRDGALRAVIDGSADVATILLAGRIHDLVTVPVTAGDEVLGGLVFAVELGEEAVREFKHVTHSEIAFVAGDRIVAATRTSPDLLAMIGRAGGVVPGRPATKVMVDGEHFMGLAGELDGAGPGTRLGYVLLNSYERPLLALMATQRQFLWIRILGILVATVVVWLLVRSVTGPLRQLRDSAEAVGRGDFTRRVEVVSRDECGELATVFNEMTSNLEASRGELEKAVDTLRSTQAQLIQSEKMRAIGTLAGGIAHDFNNILGAIIGFGELAMEDVPKDGAAARNLRQVLKGGQRAKEVVRQILAFSRQSGPKREKTRVGTVIEETARLLRATIPATVVIRTRIGTSDDVVMADATQLHQVLMNLGLNASHAMRDHDGVLTFALDDFEVPEGGCREAPGLRPGPCLRLAVTDTGHGMDRAVADRVFEPFFTTKPVGEGTGLGLSVVHGIIEHHGGEIAVESEPGVGTTFTIHLPKVRLGPVDASPSCIEPVRGANERLLVVDDEVAMADMLQQRLTRLGYEVVAHHDSLAALAEFRAATTPFNLVITDQTMPKMTGTDLAAEVVRLHADTPVIICTGSVQTLGPADGRRPAVRDCLSKPVDFVELSRAIRKALEETPRRASVPGRPGGDIDRL